MNKLQSIITGFMAALGIVGLMTLPAMAADDCGTPAQCAQVGTNQIGGDQNQPKLEDGIKNIVNLLLFILGAIAVIMIIIGGIRYTTSNGDASNTKAAKDTILYAVVGLVVAILAYAIVNFVLGAFGAK
jgi:hypothetical protein